MSLRFKLLLVALSTLALPLAGWLFVRQMEVLLRQGQEQTLIASAKALARSLGALKSELPPPGAAFYVHHCAASRSRSTDSPTTGPRLLPYAQNLGPPSDAQKLKLLLCENNDWLYLLAIVRDPTRDRADATRPSAMLRDHLTLTLERGDAVAPLPARERGSGPLRRAHARRRRR